MVDFVLGSLGWNGFRVCYVFGVSERGRQRERRDVRICVRTGARYWMHFPNPGGFHTPTGAAVLSPVHDAVSVQGHEVHLAAASGPHRRKEHLRTSTEHVHQYYLYILLLVSMLSHRGAAYLFRVRAHSIFSLRAG